MRLVFAVWEPTLRKLKASGKEKRKAEEDGGFETTTMHQAEEKEKETPKGRRTGSERAERRETGGNDAHGSENEG